jgi:hypothetical protein
MCVWGVFPRCSLCPFFGVVLVRCRQRWNVMHIPQADAKWVGGLLAQLSGQQILDAFLGAGYSPEQAESFRQVIEDRIRELNSL